MQLWQFCVTVYSAPDDGRKGRPKHVERTSKRRQLFTSRHGLTSQKI